MKAEELRRDMINFLRKTGFKAYQLADLAGVPRPTVYRFITKKADGDYKQIGLHMDTVDRILKAIDPKMVEKILAAKRGIVKDLAVLGEAE